MFHSLAYQSSRLDWEFFPIPDYLRKNFEVVLQKYAGFIKIPHSFFQTA